MRGFIGIGLYKKRNLVKKWIVSKNNYFFIGKMYWEGGSTK
jgi:hypothetical protein